MVTNPHAFIFLCLVIPSRPSRGRGRERNLLFCPCKPRFLASPDRMTKRRNEPTGRISGFCGRARLQSCHPNSINTGLQPLRGPRPMWKIIYETSSSPCNQPMVAPSACKDSFPWLSGYRLPEWDRHLFREHAGRNFPARQAFQAIEVLIGVLHEYMSSRTIHFPL